MYKNTVDTLELMKNNDFEKFWKIVDEKCEKFKIESPKLKRVKKKPLKLN